MVEVSGPYAPGVDQGVEQVHGQVAQDDEERAEQGDAEDDRQVALHDRGDREPSNAVERVHLFGEYCAAEHQSDVQTEDGQDRGERGAQAVFEDDTAFFEAFGSGGADVVLSHGFQHAGAGLARILCGVQERQGQPRQQQSGGPGDGVFGERRVPGVGEQAPVVHEEGQGELAGEEDGEGDCAQGQAHGDPVEDAAFFDG